MLKPVIFKDFHNHFVRVGDQVTLLYKQRGFRGIDRAYLIDCTYKGKDQWGFVFDYAGRPKGLPIIRMREPQCLKLRRR